MKADETSKEFGPITSVPSASLQHGNASPLGRCIITLGHVKADETSKEFGPTTKETRKRVLGTFRRVTTVHNPRLTVQQVRCQKRCEVVWVWAFATVTTKTTKTGIQFVVGGHGMAILWICTRLRLHRAKNYRMPSTLVISNNPRHHRSNRMHDCRRHTLINNCCLKHG